jgi:hypothetical protein
MTEQPKVCMYPGCSWPRTCFWYCHVHHSQVCLGEKPHIERSDTMTIPIVDTRTCAEKHDPRIAELEARVDALEARYHDTVLDINDLEARVSDHDTRMLLWHIAATPDPERRPPTPAAATITWYGEPPAAASVAGTPGTSWQPGGWVDQLAAEVD